MGTFASSRITRKQSLAGSKRNRATMRNRQSNNTMRASPLSPRTNRLMLHPVQRLNQISRGIANGEYDSCILELTKILKDLKIILSGDAKIYLPEDDEMEVDLGGEASCEANDDDDRAPFAYDFSFDSPSFVKVGLSRNSSSVDAREPPTSHEQPRETSIFANPLIVKGKSFEAPLDAVLCQELTCVTIYNLALSHHLKAISMTSADDVAPRQAPSGDSKPHSNPPAYLYKALHFYEYYHQIFQNHDLGVRFPALHCMALASNLAQIHASLGDARKAEQCYRYLLSAVMFAIERKRLLQDTLRQPNTNPPQAPQRTSQLVEEFFAIVEHLVIEEDCTAPAA